MKNNVFIIFFLLLLLPAFSGAEDFLGAPVLTEGETIKETKRRLKFSVGLSHDQVLSFYKSELEGQEDIKYRNWKDATYIEDDGNRDWHSITISKGEKEKTTVTIAKDSWTWIIGTLLLRYIGVFVVLLFLFIGMKVSGAVISRIVKRIEAKKAES